MTSIGYVEDHKRTTLMNVEMDALARKNTEDSGMEELGFDKMYNIHQLFDS